MILQLQLKSPCRDVGRLFIFLALIVQGIFSIDFPFALILVSVP